MPSKRKQSCVRRVVGTMHLKGMALEVLACGHTMYPLPRRSFSRLCRKCQKGSTDYDCDPRDYMKEGGVVNVGEEE